MCFNFCTYWHIPQRGYIRVQYQGYIGVNIRAISGYISELYWGAYQGYNGVISGNYQGYNGVNIRVITGLYWYLSGLYRGNYQGYNGAISG